MAKLTKTQERRNWNDARSVAFRAAVKGWSFMDADTVRARYERAKPLAWLPEHHETLAAMAKHSGLPPHKAN